MNSASCDNEEVIIQLDEKKMNKEKIDDKVRIETNNLRTKIKMLEEEVKKLDNKINDYESRLIYFELKEEGIDTKIINKMSEFKFIKDEFKENYNKNSIAFSLQYRATKHRDQYNQIISIIGNY